MAVVRTPCSSSQAAQHRYCVFWSTLQSSYHTHSLVLHAFPLSLSLSFSLSFFPPPPSSPTAPPPSSHTVSLSLQLLASSRMVRLGGCLNSCAASAVCAALSVFSVSCQLLTQALTPSCAAASAALTSTAGHDKSVTCCTWSGVYKMAVSGGADRQLILWNPFSCRPLGSLSGHVAPLVAVALNERQHQVVSAAADKTIKVSAGS